MSAPEVRAEGPAAAQVLSERNASARRSLRLGRVEKCRHFTEGTAATTETAAAGGPLAASAPAAATAGEADPVGEPLARWKARGEAGR